MTLKKIALALPLLGLAACASVPTGPSVMVLPGSTKTFDQFRIDDSGCRQFAQAQIGGTSPGQAQADAGVSSAAIGTVVGAVAGAAIGGRDGAAIGAGSGLIVGAAAGSDSARVSAYGTQRQYDHAYIQCMYARGHRVPVQGGLTEGGPVRSAPASTAPPTYYPPPPPSAPPPPPPPAKR